MAQSHPRGIRRRILLALYRLYNENPHQMFSPVELMQSAEVDRKDLSSNVNYLQERGLVEVMAGFNPPLFDAVHIAPDGVDLVEDEPEFDRRFPETAAQEEGAAADVISLVLGLASEADRTALNGSQKEWLVMDIRQVLEELRKPVHLWRRDLLVNSLRWVEDYFDGDAAIQLPSLGKLKAAIDAHLKP